MAACYANEGSVEAANTVTPLFDIELEYVTDMAPVVPVEDRQGDYIGSGTGRLTGRLHGGMRWSMFAADCAYLLVQAGVDPGPGEHLCTVNPGGFIETDDGAQIRFEARGYGLRGADKVRPHLWRLTAALQFVTTDDRYSWLNTTLGMWECIFDEQTRRATYRAYEWSAPGTPAALIEGENLDLTSSTYSLTAGLQQLASGQVAGAPTYGAAYS